ncbi:MAG: ornithine cyclodeaminase family protein [Litoreibacter sp.]
MTNAQNMLDLEKSKIMGLFDLELAARCIKDAYIASSKGDVQTAEVGHLSFPAAKGDCHIKSGHIAGTDSYVIKIASGFYDNPSAGLPSSNGMMLAFSSETGMPKAILRDEGWLTDMRTAIGGASAALALARSSATEVLIVGTGVQARLQAQCLHDLAEGRSFTFKIWGRDADKALAVVADLGQLGIQASVATDLPAALKTAEVIVTTTPSTSALFEDGLVQSGATVVAIGADGSGKQELPVSLVINADLRVCDMIRQSSGHGEFEKASMLKPEIEIIELGTVLSGAHAGRTNASDIIVVDLTGIAAQDIAITQTILEAAASTNS